MRDYYIYNDYLIYLQNFLFKNNWLILSQFIYTFYIKQKTTKMVSRNYYIVQDYRYFWKIISEISLNISWASKYV